VNKNRAVIFDIDGTLTDHNSWYEFTHDIGSSKEEHGIIYADFSAGKITYEDAKNKILAMWQVTGNANKTKIADIYSKWPIRKEAYPLIDWLKSEKYKVCLITGATRPYAQQVASLLGVEDYYANADFHFDKDDQLIDWHYDADQASVKLEQFHEYCHLHNINPEDCVAVGDSSNDINLFKVTKHGILVDNDHAKEELRSAAWKTVKSLSEIRSIISL
jgi:phosphoserine phosphatase